MVGNGFLFHAEQVVWRDVESFAKIYDIFVIEFQPSPLVHAKIPLVFAELIRKFRLRYY